MFNIIRDTSQNIDFRSLTKMLDEDLAVRYGELQAQYSPYNIVDNLDTIVVGYVDSQKAGCGCFRAFDKDSVEIKRMYVKPEYRGSGIAAMILRELEKWALEKGYSKSVLETGSRQPESIRFYTKMGYRPIENYGHYRNDPNSLCMSKDLKSRTS